MLKMLPLIIGWLINKSLTLAVIGICTIFLGKAIGYLLERDPRFWRTSALVAVLAWSWMVFNEISRIIIDPSLPPDSLVMSIITGIIIIVASGLTTHLLSKRYRVFFQKKEDEETSESGGADEDVSS